VGFVDNYEGSRNGGEFSSNIGGENARGGPHFKNGGVTIVGEENSDSSST